jgi:mRNA-degrading endonuclease RelE of RelBE toxin-antitoxin system
MASLEKKLRTLSPKHQQEVERFIDDLINHKQHKTARSLKQDWAGILKGHKDQFTSLELQKKALEWRTS